MTNWTLIAANILSIIFAIGGIFLASQSKPGWGWCFVLAAVCAVTVKSKSEETED